MKQRNVFALGVIVAVGLFVFGVPAQAATRGHPATPKTPKVSVTWANGASFTAAEPYRWDGELYKPLNRVYFLGYRNLLDNSTNGEVWYYDVVAQTFTDAGVAMPVPVSNYEISPLVDANGTLGFYIFGGRDNNGAIVTTVQIYYPATNTTATDSLDPWPGTTPSACVSLPGMGVATVANHAFLLGGASFSTSVPPCVDDNSAQTWIYFPKKAAGTRWKQGPNLTQARGYITAGVLGHTIYAIGGDVNNAGTLTAQPTVEAWTPPLGGWSAKAPIPTTPGCDESQAFGFPSGALANDVVLAGCGQWPGDVPDTWLYNTTSNSWSDVGAFNHSRRNHAGVLIGSKMYVFGGVTNSGGLGVQVTEIGTGHPTLSRPGYMGPDRISGGRPPTN